MNTNRENEWIDKVLNSAAGQPRATPPAHLFNSIRERIKQPVTKGKVISLRVASAAAACILLLLAMNIYTAVHTGTVRGGRGAGDARALVQYYDITNDKEINGL